jgi:hypothetical protein
MRIMRRLSMNERLYHPVHLWEDAKNGLFETTPTALDDEGPALIAASADLLKSEDGLLSAMSHVAETWRYSAEVNLSNKSMNRRAWLGQAACCFECGANENLVKAAWWSLTEDEMAAANGIADIVIAQWEQTAEGFKRGKDLFN